MDLFFHLLPAPVENEGQSLAGLLGDLFQVQEYNIGWPVAQVKPGELKQGLDHVSHRICMFDDFSELFLIELFGARPQERDLCLSLDHAEGVEKFVAHIRGITAQITESMP